MKKFLNYIDSWKLEDDETTTLKRLIQHLLYCCFAGWWLLGIFVVFVVIPAIIISMPIYFTIMFMR